jgi:hypothetical protein
MLFVPVRVVVWAFAFFAIVEHVPSHIFVGSKGQVQRSHQRWYQGTPHVGLVQGKTILCQ